MATIVKSMLDIVLRREAPKEPRATKRSRWLHDLNRRMTAQERATLQSLPDLIPSVEIGEGEVDLSPQKVSSLIREVLAIKDGQDVLEGRYRAIRSIVFRAMDHRFGKHEPGELPGDGKKFVRSVSAQVEVDWDAWRDRLREALGDDEAERVWSEVTVMVPQVDEARVVEVIQSGRVPESTLDGVASVKYRETLYVRDVERSDGEA